MGDSGTSTNSAWPTVRIVNAEFGAKAVRIVCPGACEDDIYVTSLPNGVRIEIEGAEELRAPFDREFVFDRQTDGVIVLREDESTLENGVLTLWLRPAPPQRMRLRTVASQLASVRSETTWRDAMTRGADEYKVSLGGSEHGSACSQSWNHVDERCAPPTSEQLETELAASAPAVLQSKQAVVGDRALVASTQGLATSDAETHLPPGAPGSRIRAASCPALSDVSLESETPLGTLESSLPSSSSTATCVQPSQAVLSRVQWPLPSFGSVGHGVTQCMICKPHFRGECLRGTQCHRCHDPSHQNERGTHGSGRSRFRTAQQKAALRNCRTPSPPYSPVL